jgi:hypothetical protein
LRNVELLLRGAGPAEITSADLQLAPDGVHIRKLNASAAESSWSGSLDLPRGCGNPSSCELHFDLKTNRASLSALSDWVNPSPKARPWYRLLETSATAAPSFLGSVRAVGRIAVDRLQAGSVTASQVSANMSLDSGKLEIAQVTANLLQGKYNGKWKADFTTKPGTCGGSGRFTGVSLAHLAQSMNEGWITGTASAAYELKGNCPAGFWSSAEGSVEFDLLDGVLPHVTLSEGGEPLKLTRFSGRAELRNGKVELKGAKLDSVGVKYELSGTASLHRELNLTLGRASGGYSIRGTLTEPQVGALSGPEQARLKQ